MKKEEINWMKNCIRHKITISLCHFSESKTIKKKRYFANTWYVELNNNGEKKIYEKPVGKGKTMVMSKNPKAEMMLMNTWKFWSEKIDKEKTKISQK
jgi:hypothetical protein